MTISYRTERRVSFTLLALLTMLVTASVALGQDAPEAAAYPAATMTDGPTEDVEIVAQALDGVSKHDAGWSARIGVILVGIVAFARKYAVQLPDPAGAFFRSSEGGSVLLFLVTLAGGIGTVLSVGGVLTRDLLGDTFVLAVTTAGGWHMLLKPLWERVLRPLLVRFWPSRWKPLVPPDVAGTPIGTAP